MRRKESKPIKFCLDVAAAYNRGGLPISAQSSADVSSIEELLAHPFQWKHLTDSDTEDVLMEIYVARRTRMQ